MTKSHLPIPNQKINIESLFFSFQWDIEWFEMINYSTGMHQLLNGSMLIDTSITYHMRLCQIFLVQEVKPSKYLSVDNSNPKTAR